MPAKRDVGLRFWEKVDVRKPDECWPWLGSLVTHGYGTISAQGRHRPAHVWMNYLQQGDIPPGWQVDHLCRNRACVNPAHLEAVTQLVNLQRQGAAKTKCPQGYLYTGDNLYVRPNGRRMCRGCRRDGMRKAA